MKKSEELSYNNIKELLFKLYPIQVFTTFSGALSGFFNGLITGHFLSASEMVAIGLIAPLTLVFSSLSSIFSSGASILAGRYMGRGQGNKINRVFSVTTISIVILGVILTIICYIFAPNLAIIFGATNETLKYTIDYIRGISLGLTPVMLVPCFMAFLQIGNKSKVSLGLTLLLAFFVVVFGLFNVSVLNYGIYGMGLATSASEYLVMIITIIYLFIKRNIVSFKISDFNIKDFLTVLKLGLPSSLAGILYAIRNVFVNSTCIEVGGLEAGNALAILYSLSGFIDAFNVGLGATANMIISMFIGEKDASSIKKFTRITAVFGVIIGILKLIFFILFASPITIFFGGNSDVIALTRSLLIWTGIAHILNMVQLTINSTYACEGKTALCTFQILLNAIIVPFICLYITTKVGINFAWKLYFLGEVGSLLLFYIVACVKKKALINTLDDLLYLHTGFKTDGTYSMTINSLEEVTNISNNLQAFCLEHNIDARRSMLAGLCVEELCANIIENEFDKDKKENTIDIFTSIYKNEISIRLRDNCVPFDPHSKLGMENKDITEDVGIKLVAKIAKEMNYQISYSMNVLIIKL